jgi:hypothetical protein
MRRDRIVAEGALTERKGTRFLPICAAEIPIYAEQNSAFWHPVSRQTSLEDE